MKDTIAELIEALKDQRGVFGDLMLDSIRFPEISAGSFSSGVLNAHAPVNTAGSAAAAGAIAGNPGNGNAPVSGAGLGGGQLVREQNLHIQRTEAHQMEQPGDKRNRGLQEAATLEELNKNMLECHYCPLEKLRNKLVFGKGNPDADVMIIGEAPGADEDKQGEPFVGRAGRLLTDILKAINFTREEVYITNVVKCRPPGNRNPLPEEMKQCLPYLYRQIEIIKPKMILCLGLISAGGVLNLKQTLSKMRGNVYQLGDIKVMVTYHPAALLRNPEWKRGAWEDVQKFRKLYDEIMKTGTR